MPKLRHILLSFSLTSCALAGHASAEPISLSTYVTDVLAHHPGLRAAVLRRNAARTGAGAEGLFPDPSVTVMFDRFPDRMGEMPMVRWQAQQMLPWPGKLALMREAADAQAAGSTAIEEARRLDVTLQAKQAWAMLAMNARRREVNRMTGALVEGIAKAARARYAAGTGGHHDMVRAEVERNANEVERLTLDGERTAAVAMLNALRNLAADTPIEDPAPYETALPPLDLTKLTTKALGNRPEFREMQAMGQQMRSMAQLARRERYPDLMVGVWLNQMLGGPDTAGAMVGGTIPLFGVKRQGLRADSAELQAEAFDRELDAMRAMVRFQVADAVRKVDTATRQLAFLRGTALGRTKESFKSALAGYASGAVDVTGLLDARRAMQTSEQAVVDTVVQRELAIAELERALWGQPVEEAR
jgi:cobalt-zinc-cadmium efflux system outer membrane protein